MGQFAREAGDRFVNFDGTFCQIAGCAFDQGPVFLERGIQATALCFQGESGFREGITLGFVARSQAISL